MKTIIFLLSLVLFVTVGCSGDSADTSAGGGKTLPVRYLPDEKTESLQIVELTGDELINLAGQRDISLQNLAITLDRLKAFPGNNTVLAAIPFIDRRDMIQRETLKTSGEEEVWELGEIKLGKVAILTLRAITGEDISNPEGWLAWYQDHKSALSER